MTGTLLLALGGLMVAVVVAALVTVVPVRSRTVWFDGRDFY